MNKALDEIDERIARERAINRNVVQEAVTETVEEAIDPLHLGRTSRLAKPKLSKALAERDRRCIWYGCDKVPEQTQRHHEVPWAQGGGTDIETMSLLCTFHHGLIGKGWELCRWPTGEVYVLRTRPPETDSDPPF